MKIRAHLSRDCGAVLVLVVGLLATGPHPAANAGVTLITHGLNGDTDGWVTGMANQIPNYERFAGTNYSSYHVYFFYSAGSYFLTAVRDGGSEPFSPESGEIILKLDWRLLADGNSYNTHQVAADRWLVRSAGNWAPTASGLTI